MFFNLVQIWENLENAQVRRRLAAKKIIVGDLKVCYAETVQWMTCIIRH